MYAALWRVLPRQKWLKVLILFVIFLAVVAILLLWVYPFFDGILGNGAEPGVTVDK